MRMIIPKHLKYKKPYEIEYNLINNNEDEKSIAVDKDISNTLLKDNCKELKEKQETLETPDLVFSNKKEYDLIYKLQSESVWDREEEVEKFFEFSE